MEFEAFSNTPYASFFINVFDTDIEKGTLLKGSEWMHMPMSIPVSSHYKCTGINQKYIFLEGWITLDEDKLDTLLTQKKFTEHASSYHFSKDFRIESDIKICIDIKTAALHTASFKMDINGESGKLKEKMSYEINSNLNENPNPNQSYIVGPLREIDGAKNRWRK